MQKVVVLGAILLLTSSFSFCDSVFMAVSEDGLKGDRTTFEEQRFKTDTDGMSSKFVFRIDSADLKTLVVEQVRPGFPLNSNSYFITSSTGDFVQAVGFWDGTVQTYTIMKKEEVVYYTNQRATFLDGLGRQWPSVVSAMWGRIKLTYDYTN